MIKLYPIVTSVRTQKWGVTKRVETPTWDLILKYGLSQGFGAENTIPSMMEAYNNWGLLGHNGWDIVTFTGDPIYAANDGIVNQDTVDRSGGIGLDIWNEEGSFKTRYWHNLQNIARMGDKVKKGDLIAYSDNTGFSTGSHIHFALKLTDKYGSTINNNNAYRGAIDPTPHIVDNKTMKLIIYNGEQYLRNAEGIDTHIVGAYSLAHLERLNVENEVPEEVKTVNLGDYPQEFTFIPLQNE